MTHNPLPAVLGFAFITVAFAVGLGVALFALVVAILAQAGYALAKGELNLNDLQERAESARSGFANPEGGTGRRVS